MATLTVDFFTSLDGNGSAPGWPGYWGKEGPELRDYLVKKYARDQVLVYGATTFRAFREFVVEYDEPYHEGLNALPKIVFQPDKFRTPTEYGSQPLACQRTRSGRSTFGRSIA